MISVFNSNLLLPQTSRAFAKSSSSSRATRSRERTGQEEDSKKSFTSRESRKSFDRSLLLGQHHPQRGLETRDRCSSDGLIGGKRQLNTCRKPFGNHLEPTMLTAKARGLQPIPSVSERARRFLAAEGIRSPAASLAGSPRDSDEV